MVFVRIIYSITLCSKLFIVVVIAVLLFLFRNTIVLHGRCLQEILEIISYCHGNGTIHILFIRWLRFLFQFFFFRSILCKNVLLANDSFVSAFQRFPCCVFSVWLTVTCFLCPARFILTFFYPCVPNNNCYKNNNNNNTNWQW